MPLPVTHRAMDPAVFYPIVSNLSELTAMTQLGYHWIQWRCKSSTSDYPKVLQLFKKHQTHDQQRLILNDDWRAAAELACDGVHLGQQDLPSRSQDYTATIAALKIFGISVHNLTELNRALLYQPSYIALGPLYSSPSKKVDGALSHSALVELLHTLQQQPQRPQQVVAIGGITAHNARQTLSYGFHKIAFISWNQRIIQERYTPDMLWQKLA